MLFFSLLVSEVEEYTCKGVISEFWEVVKVVGLLLHVFGVPLKNVVGYSLVGSNSVICFFVLSGANESVVLSCNHCLFVSVFIFNTIPLL
jgi:hypothetical protein